MKRPILLFAASLALFHAGAQTTNPAPYCQPTLLAPTAYISNITGPGLNQSSTIYNSSSYVFYNNLPTLIATVGAPYSVSIDVGGNATSAGTFALSIYVDINHNNQLETTEIFGETSLGNQSSGSFTTYFQPPDTALYGITRMRFLWSDHGSNACENGPYFGEGEDYMISIVGTYALSTTTTATGITTSGATVNGLVNANNPTATAAVAFEYGLTTTYSFSVGAGNVSAQVNTPVSTTLTGLNPNTTYHYRVKSVNSNGTSYGKDMTFKTKDPNGVATIAQDAFTIAPNPAKNVFRINGELKDLSVLDICITDLLGRTVFSGHPDRDGVVRLPQLTSGIYNLMATIAGAHAIYRTKLAVE